MLRWPVFSAILRSTAPALVLTATAIAQQSPATLRIDGAFLARFKKHPDAAIMSIVRAEADRAMDAGPFSVMQKKQTPPSGDKHDFMSLAPYWWPNPATANGLPYIRRDGETNPQEATISDHANLFHLEDDVHALALGYYLTGDERYAGRAALLLRTWFLDPATRMNPNLNYAQAILGITEGRGIGLIGMRDIPRLLDGITLLSSSASLTRQEREGLRAWFSSYIDWLQNSRNGRDEAAAKNNHGSWYDQQLAAIALFLGNRSLVRQTGNAAETKRIALQIRADGGEPLELARTKSFSYSIFNLTALMHLAQEGQRAGVDLWNYQAKDGASIRVALNFLLPYALGSKPWPYQSLNGVQSSSLVEPLLLGAIAWKSPAYLNDAVRLKKNPRAEVLLLEQDARETLATK